MNFMKRGLYKMGTENYAEKREKKKQNQEKAKMTEQEKKDALSNIKKNMPNTPTSQQKADEIKSEIINKNSLDSKDENNKKNKNNNTLKDINKKKAYLEKNEYYESVDFINKLLHTKISSYSVSSVKKENLGISGSPFLMAFFKHFKNIECEKVQNKRAISYSELAYSFIIDALMKTKTLEKIIEETNDEHLKVLFEKLELDIRDK